MQFFAGLEAHGLPRCNADLGAGAGIASDAGFARANAEYTKTAQLNALTSCQGFFQAFKHSVDCRFGLGAGQACALDHMVHDVLFNQSDHLASATISRLYHALPD
jgi:hypothetical protein